MANFKIIFKRLQSLFKTIPTVFWLLASLICIMIAYLESQPLKPQALSHSKPIHVMLALDRSLTMAAKDETLSRYQRAKNALQHLIKTNSDVFFGLVSFSEWVQPHLVISHHNDYLLNGLQTLAQEPAKTYSTIDHVFDYANSHMRYTKSKRYLIIFTDGHFQSQSSLVNKSRLYQITPIFIDVSHPDDILLIDDPSQVTQKKIQALSNKAPALKLLAQHCNGIYLNNDEAFNIRRALLQKAFQTQQKTRSLPTKIHLSSSLLLALLFYSFWLLSFWSKRHIVFHSKTLLTGLLIVSFFNLTPLMASELDTLSLFQSKKSDELVLIVNIPLEKNDPILSVPKNSLSPEITTHSLDHFILMKREDNQIKAWQQLVFKIWKPESDSIVIPNKSLVTRQKTILIPKTLFNLNALKPYTPLYEQETDISFLQFFVENTDPNPPIYINETHFSEFYFLSRSSKWKTFMFQLNDLDHTQNAHYCYKQDIINKINLRFYKLSFLCAYQTYGVAPDSNTYASFFQKTSASIYSHTLKHIQPELFPLGLLLDDTFPYIFSPVKLETKLNATSKTVGKPFIIAVHIESQSHLKNISQLSITPSDDIDVFQYKILDVAHDEKIFFYIATAKTSGHLSLPTFSITTFDKETKTVATHQSNNTSITVLDSELNPFSTHKKHMTTLNSDFPTSIQDSSWVLMILILASLLYNVYLFLKKRTPKQTQRLSKQPGSKQ